MDANKVKVWEVCHEGRTLLFEDFMQFSDYVATIAGFDDGTDVIITTRGVDRAEFEALPEVTE